MPVCFEILPSVNLLYYAGAGHCTGREMLRAERAAWRHPLRRPEARIVMDLQMVTALDVDLRDMKELIALNRRLAASGHALEKTAVIARHAGDFSLAESFLLLAEVIVTVRLHVSHTLAEALAWLGLSAQLIEVEATRASLRGDLLAGGGRE